jgi:hypothetical protein
MPTAAAKLFYEQHYASRALEPLDVEGAAQAMRTPGDRYYCVAHEVQDASSLTAVEWGFGSLSRMLALQQMFKHYTALDIAAQEIVEAHGVQADVRNCDLNDDLNLPDESYDVAIALMVIEHLFDPFHSFREIARITRMNGLVFINLPLVTALKNRVRLAFGELPMTSTKNWWAEREWDGGHLHYFSVSLVERLGALYGLRLLRSYPVGQWIKLKRLAPQLLCGELSFVFKKDAAPTQ